ncbi:MAG: Xaa-Pro dipeptidyl-peptidase [Planctomycetota bacterium]
MVRTPLSSTRSARPSSWKALRTVALATLISSSAALPAQETVEAESEALPQPVFEDGLAMSVPEFAKPATWVQEFVFVEAPFDSDGDGKNDRLHVDVFRPGPTEAGLTVPVIYYTSPYFAGVAQGGAEYMWDPSHELGATPPMHEHPPEIGYGEEPGMITTQGAMQWVPRGFAVVHSSSPGTGFSQGCPTIGGENESLAPKAVIDWLCGRAKAYTALEGGEEVVADWCSGKVGMTGTSYNGTLPLAAATTGVEGLEAILPIAPNTSYYLYYRSNGLVRHPGGYMGEDIDVLYDFVNSGLPSMRSTCNESIRDAVLIANQDRITGDYNDFWAGRDYLNQMDKMRCALFMSHGWNDWNVMPEHSVRIYEAAKERGLPAVFFAHQRGHGGPPPFALQNKFFTRYLHGVENQIEDDPKSWIVREGDRRPTPYGDYPNPDAAPVLLRLTAGGQSAGSLAIGDSGQQGREKLIDDVAITPSKLAAAEESDNRLIYATPELQTDLHLSGRARISIRLASDRPAANLSVYLVSLPWTDSRRINDNLISRGWADPQNANSLTESVPLVPGEFVDLSFDLNPDDQIIPAGQKIGLMIFSSDRDFTLWPKAGTQLHVDLDNTSLSLPVVGGEEAFKTAVSR